MIRRLVRAALGCIILLAGCGGGGGNSGGSDNPAPGPTELFEDDFTSGFPGAAWTTGTGTQESDAATGNAAPSLHLKAVRHQVSGSLSPTMRPGLAETAATFSSAGGLTVVADLAPVLTASSYRSSFSVLDTSGSGFIASVSFEPGNSALSPAPTPAMTFSIGGTTASFANPASGIFHLYQFKVTPAGVATWTMDGSQKLSATGIAPGAMRLQVLASGFTGEASPTFLGQLHADNVRVTAP